MKKFLSLVLALVMTMSLVTVSAGAKDFTDSTKINYDEAVAVMSAVKVIDGYTDGSFNPSATLTRGAAAKIICNLILGPTTASALVADAAPYKDVPTNHTFAGYIAYCQKEGIISGYADGTFKPANSLTGYAFMKMLLGALGYKAEQEGYTGPNWSINVAKRAMNIGLKDGLKGDFNGVKAVNREEACLYAFNTLKATMVEYEKNSTVTVGNITIKDTSDAKEVVNNVRADNTIKDDGKMQFAEKYFTDLKEFDSTDDFYRPATQWKIKSEEVGKYTDTPDLTYTKAVKASDIYKDLALGSTIDKKDVTVYINGEEAEDAAVVLKKSNDAKIGKDYLEKSGKKYSTAKNGVLTEVFYDKDDDSVIITQVVTYVGQINKSVAATSKKDAYVVIDTLSSTQNVMAVPSDLTGKTVSKSLEFETDDKFEDDDYVLYTYSQTADEVKSVAAAEKVEGYVSKTTNSTKDEDENKGITIADTAYKMSAATTGEPLGEVSVKNDYTAYLDQYGYVIYVEEIEEIGNYALLINVADKGTFVGKKAELVFTDGTSKVVTTEKDYSKARFNYEERGQKTLLVKPRMDQRDGDHMVHSRIGLEYPCVYFDEMRALSEDALKENACIIVDEAQFLSKEEVDYLVHVVDDLGVPVICYGLRADFKGELFPGSYELLVMADKLEEVKTICWCGKKAMFNARFDENGKVLKEGAQVVLGANDKYIGLCRRHWRAGDLGPDFNGKGTGD